MKVDVLQQVAALPGLPVAELKRMWRELFGSEPPIAYDKRFMVKRLAYRLQELAYGGLSQQTVERLKRLAQDENLIGAVAADTPARPVVGTRLIREWKGVDHCVTVLPEGYEYLGQPFRSLSAVARTITGTRWNGWAFFGMRGQGAGGKP